MWEAEGELIPTEAFIKGVAWNRNAKNIFNLKSKVRNRSSKDVNVLCSAKTVHIQDLAPYMNSATDADIAQVHF